MGLQGWREILSSSIRWDDRNHQTSDILDARLRAKYYGTLYIINRPLLEYALHRMPGEITAETKEKVLAYRNTPRNASSDQIQLTVSDLEVYHACVDCIEAARRSTTVLDGIIFDQHSSELRKRLIVTNIVGTAHA
jgi:hypothetical protein